MSVKESGDWGHKMVLIGKKNQTEDLIFKQKYDRDRPECAFGTVWFNTDKAA